MILKRGLFFLLGIGLFMILRAQRKDVIYGQQQWFQYYGGLTLSDRWAWLTDGGLRFDDAWQRDKYFIRTDFSYTWQAHIEAAFGAAFLTEYEGGRLATVTIRPHQELGIHHSYTHFNIRHRIRVEEIFETEQVSKLHYFRFRFRYRFLTTIPLFALSSSNPDMRLFLNIGDEILLNAGNEVVYDVFDQNRFLLGTEIRLSPALSISITYISQFSSTDIPGAYSYDDIIRIGFKHQIGRAEKP